MMRSGCAAEMGKTRGKRSGSGGGFGLRTEKAEDDVGDLTRQLNKLVEQLNDLCA